MSSLVIVFLVLMRSSNASNKEIRSIINSGREQRQTIELNIKLIKSNKKSETDEVSQRYPI